MNATLVFLLFGQIIVNKQADAHPPLGPVRLEIQVVKIVDGDSIEAKVHYPMLGPLDKKLRAIGYTAHGMTLKEDIDTRLGRGPAALTPGEVKRAGEASRALRDVFEMGVVYVEPEGAENGCHQWPVRFVVKPSKGALIDVAKWMHDHGHTRADKDTVDKKKK